MKIGVLLIISSIFITGIFSIPNADALEEATISMFELCTDYGILDIENKSCTLTRDVPHTIQIGTALVTSPLSSSPNTTPDEWHELDYDGIIFEPTTKQWHYDFLWFDKFTINGNGHKIILSNEECKNGNWAAITARNNNFEASSLILKNIHIDGSDWSCKRTTAGKGVVPLAGINVQNGITVIGSEIFGTTGHGIVANGGQMILKNNFIHDIKKDDNDRSVGVSVYSRNLGETPLIENNRISNTGIGIVGEDIIITNNEISDNEIGIQTAKKGIISNNIFKNNDIAIDSSYQTISNNEFINNDKNSSDKQNNWEYDFGDTKTSLIETPLFPSLAPFVDSAKDPQHYIERYCG